VTSGLGLDIEDLDVDLKLRDSNLNAELKQIFDLCQGKAHNPQSETMIETLNINMNTYAMVKMTI
jgi:hypothetical protein